MLTAEARSSLVAELASRPGHEKVRALLHRLLTDGMGVDSRDIDFEKPAPEVRGRIDALLGPTVFELKSDLRRERAEAEQGLARYLAEREGQTGESWVGIATDGADCLAYFRRGDVVVEVGAHRTDPEAPRELLAWLGSTVAIGEELLPDPHLVRREFGRESLAARRALDGLGALLNRIGDTPEARLKRGLWEQLLSLAYGADVGDDALFLQHTYLVVVAKARAAGRPIAACFATAPVPWPRRLILVEPAPAAGVLPPDPAVPLVRGCAGNQDKAPWKTLQPPRGTVESEFLRPALLGESIAPFRVLTPRTAVVPWDAARGGLMDAEKAAERGWSRLARWLDETERLWERHKSSIDYHAELSCQFPIAPVRVVYTKAGTNLAAAPVRHETAVVESGALLGGGGTRRSPLPLRRAEQRSAARRRRRTSRRASGARATSTSTSSTCRSRASTAPARSTAGWPTPPARRKKSSPPCLCEREHFLGTRRRIRAALADHGIAAEIDSLTFSPHRAVPWTSQLQTTRGWPGQAGPMTIEERASADLLRNAVPAHSRPPAGSGICVLRCAVPVPWLHDCSRGHLGVPAGANPYSGNGSARPGQ